MLKSPGASRNRRLSRLIGNNYAAALELEPLRLEPFVNPQQSKSLFQAIFTQKRAQRANAEVKSKQLMIISTLSPQTVN